MFLAKIFLTLSKSTAQFFDWAMNLVHKYKLCLALVTFTACNSMPCNVLIAWYKSFGHLITVKRFIKYIIKYRPSPVQGSSTLELRFNRSSDGIKSSCFWTSQSGVVTSANSLVLSLVLSLLSVSVLIKLYIAFNHFLPRVIFRLSKSFGNALFGIIKSCQFAMLPEFPNQARCSLCVFIVLLFGVLTM